ncbi:uncharacterized protein [Typha angustifolia]|uniref:uncharacterized protein n=1 Tax=Typha angustifolia TaxID=59011 RepID=UPI003C30E429
MYKLLPKPKSQIQANFSNSSEMTQLEDIPPPEFLREAIFAAGRFWEIEAAFGGVDGVIRTATGYFGGSTVKPSYKEVIEGNTGHTEAVKVIYDKRRVSYKSLCKVFWTSHDPTNKHYLEFGVDTHYRSAIFYGNEEEKKEAQETKVKHQMKLNKRIVTKILSRNSNNCAVFYMAENQHHKYYLQRDHIPLCESLGLRSTQHFANSHIACKLNGILGGPGNKTSEELKSFMERYQLPKQTMLVLEEILHNLGVKKGSELED